MKNYPNGSVTQYLFICCLLVIASLPQFLNYYNTKILNLNIFCVYSLNFSKKIIDKDLC